MEIDWKTWRESKAQEERIGLVATSPHKVKQQGPCDLSKEDPLEKQRSRAAADMRLRRASYLTGVNEFDFAFQVKLLKNDEEERLEKAMAELEQARAKEQSENVGKWQAVLDDKKLKAAMLILTWFRRWREKHPKKEIGNPQAKFIRDKFMAHAPCHSSSGSGPQLTPEQIKARDDAIAKQAARVKKESEAEAERLRVLRERGNKQISEWRAARPDQYFDTTPPSSRSQLSNPSNLYNPALQSRGASASAPVSQGNISTEGKQLGSHGEASLINIESKASQGIESFLNESALQDPSILRSQPQPASKLNPLEHHCEENDEPVRGDRPVALTSKSFMARAMHWTSAFLPGLTGEQPSDPNPLGPALNDRVHESHSKIGQAQAAPSERFSPNPDPHCPPHSPPPPQAYAWPQASNAHCRWEPSNWTSSNQISEEEEKDIALMTPATKPPPPSSRELPPWGNTARSASSMSRPNLGHFAQQPSRSSTAMSTAHPNPLSSMEGRASVDPQPRGASRQKPGSRRISVEIDPSSLPHQLLATTTPGGGGGQEPSRLPASYQRPRASIADFCSNSPRAMDPTPPGSQRSTPRSSHLDQVHQNQGSSGHLPPLQTNRGTRRASIDNQSGLPPPPPVGGARGRRGSIDETVLRAAVIARGRDKLPDITKSR